MSKQFKNFLIRWLANSGGFWLAIWLLPGMKLDGGWLTLLLTALVFSIINSIIKPILVIFSLPFILVTLGAFMLVVNGTMVYLTSIFYDNLSISGFTTAVLAGIVIAVVNYIISLFIDTSYENPQTE